MDTTDNRDEIDSIIRVCDKAFAEPVTEREIYSDLLQKLHQKGLFVFAYQDAPMGYAAFYANDSETKTAYISLIAVKPEYQKLHIGKQLLNCCLEIAQMYGMQSCSLEVKKDNRNAIRFYQANGFVFLSERENSFLMTRKLASQEGKTYEYQRQKSYASCNGEAGL